MSAPKTDEKVVEAAYLSPPASPTLKPSVSDPQSTPSPTLKKTPVQDEVLAADESPLKETLAPSETPTSEKTPTPDKTTTTDEFPALDETPTQAQVNDLKTRLELNTGKCHSITENRDAFCSLSMPSTATQIRIDALVTALAINFDSDDKLEETLRELAQRIHCQCHTGKIYIELRINKWWQAMPADKAGRPRTLPTHRSLRVLEYEFPTCCTGFNKSLNNCGYKLRGEKMLESARLMDQIITCVTAPRTGESLGSLLESLKASLLCPFHDKRRIRSQQGQWILEQQDSWITRLEVFENDCRAALEESNQRIRRATPEPTPSAPQPSAGLQTPPATPRHAIGSRDARGLDTSAFILFPKSEALSKEEIRKSVQGIATETLDQTTKSRNQSEKNPGYLYAYQVDGNKGFVKIGYTTRDPKLRHAEWQGDCHRKMTVVHQSPEIPHAWRAERLVHAELLNQLVRVDCKACRKQHKEWFEIPKDKAIEVIEKWTTWMMDEPYHEIVTRAGSRWSLKWEKLKGLNTDRLLPETEIVEIVE